MRARTALVGVLVAAVTAVGLGTAAPPASAIWGGTPESVTEHPAAGQLWSHGTYTYTDERGRERRGRNIRPGCGVTLVAAEWALTAAHCVTGRDGKVDRHGKYRIRTDPASSLEVVLDSQGTNYFTATKIRVRSVVVHPEWFETGPAPRRTWNADVALLQLRDPQPGHPTMTLAGAAFPDGTPARSIGWGCTDRYRDAGDCTASLIGYRELAAVDVAIDDAGCGVLASDPGGLAPTEVCTLGDGTGQIRPGDSGGPLLVRSGGRWVQAGIHSWLPTGTAEMNDRLAISTSTAAVIDWIETQTGPLATEDSGVADDGTGVSPYRNVPLPAGMRPLDVYLSGNASRVVYTGVAVGDGSCRYTCVIGAADVDGTDLWSVPTGDNPHSIEQMSVDGRYALVVEAINGATHLDRTEVLWWFDTVAGRQVELRRISSSGGSLPVFTQFLADDGSVAFVDYGEPDPAAGGYRWHIFRRFDGTTAQTLPPELLGTDQRSTGVLYGYAADGTRVAFNDYDHTIGGNRIVIVDLTTGARAVGPVETSQVDWSDYYGRRGGVFDADLDAAVDIGDGDGVSTLGIYRWSAGGTVTRREVPTFNDFAAGSSADATRVALIRWTATGGTTTVLDVLTGDTTTLDRAVRSVDRAASTGAFIGYCGDADIAGLCPAGVTSSIFTVDL